MVAYFRRSIPFFSPVVRLFLCASASEAMTEVYPSFRLQYQNIHIIIRIIINSPTLIFSDSSAASCPTAARQSLQQMQARCAKARGRRDIGPCISPYIETGVFSWNAKSPVPKHCSIVNLVLLICLDGCLTNYSIRRLRKSSKLQKYMKWIMPVVSG